MPSAFTLSGKQLARHTGLQQVRVYACLRSTHVRAAELIEQNQLRTPAAILTARQTAGRGQRSNTWWSDAGTLTVTFALPANPEIPAHQLPLRVGVALHETVARWIAPEHLRIKWPNDLITSDHRKLAGILCQRVRDTDILGIGINVHSDLAQAPPSVRSRAASMNQLCSDPPPLQDLFIDLAQALLQLNSDEAWWHKLARLHALMNRLIVVDEGPGAGGGGSRLICGQCRGIDEQGCLLVDDGATLHHLLSGTVRSWE